MPEVKALKVRHRRPFRALWPARALVLCMLSLAAAWAPVWAGDDAAPAVAAWERAVGLMRAGKPGEAKPILLALHRAVPGSAAVTLELALAHFRLEEDAESRRLFLDARSLPLSGAQRGAVDQYLARIRARYGWQFAFSAGLVPQSNASRRTAADRVVIGGLDFILDQRPRSGMGLDFNLGATYRRPVGAGRIGLGAALQGRVFRQGEWNDYTLLLDASLSQGNLETGLTSAGLVVRPRWLGDSPYAVEYGPQITHIRKVGERTALRLRVERLRREARADGLDDAGIWRLSLALAHDVSEQTSLTGGLSAGRISATTAEGSAKIYSAGLGISRRFDDWQISAGASVLWERRDGPSQLFGVTRDETERRLQLALTNRRARVMGFVPTIEIGREDRRSNVSIYSWQNNYAAIRFTNTF